MNKIGCLFIVCVMASCTDNNYQKEIPLAFFEDIRIELDLPQYNDLTFDGGYMMIGEGVQGIILYRENATTYHAYERTCSFDPYEAGATINVHGSGWSMFCLRCNSNFSFTNGFPIGGGPAQYPLREYQVHLDRRVLIVTDEPVI